MCITLIITPNFMANAAIEGEDGNGLTTAALYATCVAGCWTLGYFTAETTTMACIAVCSSIGYASPDEPGPEDYEPFPEPEDPTGQGIGPVF